MELCDIVFFCRSLPSDPLIMLWAYLAISLYLLSLINRSKKFQNLRQDSFFLHGDIKWSLPFPPKPKYLQLSCRTKSRIMYIECRSLSVFFCFCIFLTYFIWFIEKRCEYIYLGREIGQTMRLGRKKLGYMGHTRYCSLSSIFQGISSERVETTPFLRHNHHDPTTSRPR